MSAALAATQSHLPGLPASAPVVLICLLSGQARSSPSSSVVEVVQPVPLAELQEAVVLAGLGNGLAWRTASLAAIATVGAEHATSTGGPVFVSLAASQQQPPSVGTQEAHPDLLEAAKWFLETVQLPKQHDIGRVKERQGYCCQDPECRRRSLRVEAHHLVFRSHGGGDEPENLVTLCRACHLRLVHTGTGTVRREQGRRVWDLPGRCVVVFGQSSAGPVTTRP